MGGYTEYYDVLGVSPTDSDDAIKKAYRRLALKHHPDKQGDPEQFKRVNEAYEVLKDPAKRRMYDQYGPGVEDQGVGGPPGFGFGFAGDGGSSGGGGGGGPVPMPGGFSMEDVFGSFFGGFQGFHPSRQGAGAFGADSTAGAFGASPKKARAIKHTVFLSLEEIYKGKKLRVAVDRAILCPKCAGEGGKDVSESPCVPCAGRGFSTTSHGSFFQSSVRCQACDSTGKVKKIGEPCRGCKATGMSTERVVLEPVVNPGDKSNLSFVFRGKGNCVSAKNSVPGDVVITTVQQPSSLFTRKGHDLHTDIRISLKECLSGFSKSVKHLDGRAIDICAPRGKVTPPGTIVRVANEGIPANKGALFVKVNVAFPETLSDSSIEMLGILPELSH